LRFVLSSPSDDADIVLAEIQQVISHVSSKGFMPKDLVPIEVRGPKYYSSREGLTDALLHLQGWVV